MLWLCEEKLCVVVVNKSLISESVCVCVCCEGMEKEGLVWEKKNIWKAIKMKNTFIVLRTVCDCFVGLDKVLKQAESVL